MRWHDGFPEAFAQCEVEDIAIETLAGPLNQLASLDCEISARSRSNHEPIRREENSSAKTLLDRCLWFFYIYLASVHLFVNLNLGFGPM